MDNVIEVKYNGLENKTYEVLEKSVFYADIGNSNLSQSDTILDITPMRFYEGKVLNDSAKIGFRITLTTRDTLEFYHHLEKIVFVFDGERLEVELRNMIQSNRRKEYSFSSTEIVGLNPGTKVVLERAWKDIVLQPKDVKRIANAKDVGVYIDAYNKLDANGGYISFRDGSGSFQIEGLQGAMKRAFHYFVDITCYIDYCSSFLEKKQEALETERQRIEAEEQRIESEKQEQEQLRIKQAQEEQESIDRWHRAKRRTIITLFASIALTILFSFTESILLALIAMIVGFGCLVRLSMLNSDGNDSDIEE